MTSPAQVYAWFACILCVIFTLRCAFAFARTMPDIFLALCVYAGQWGVLIVYYSDPTNPNALLPALSGYLSAIAGFLIFRHHVNKSGKAQHEKDKLSLREETVGLLLLLIALPRLVATPFGRALLPGVTETDIEIIVTVLLDTIGYYALYHAIAISHPRKERRLMLGAPLFVYWLLNASFAITQLVRRVEGITAPLIMPDGFRYGFAFAKLVVVVTFVPAILASSPAFSKARWSKRMMVFMHLATD